jgi:phosphate transport system substrate-binding protein
MAGATIVRNSMITLWTKLTFAVFMLSTGLDCLGVYAAEKPLAGKLLITGSSTMTPMITMAGKRFSALHPGVQIEVQTVGSGQGISDAMTGKADIGMASRALTDKESGLYSFAIARDAVCMVVHKDNPVRALTNRQVIDIYTGRIDNWKKVGGKDAPITPINVKEGLGSADLFTRYFGIRYADIKAAVVVSGNPERVKVLRENPNGIAYMSLGAAQQYAASGAPLKLLPTDGVAATTKNIRTGNFPLTRPLLLLTREPPAGLKKEFINFALSSQITDIVLQHEFVPYLD